MPRSDSDACSGAGIRWRTQALDLPIRSVGQVQVSRSWCRRDGAAIGGRAERAPRVGNPRSSLSHAHGRARGNLCACSWQVVVFIMCVFVICELFACMSTGAVVCARQSHEHGLHTEGKEQYLI